MSIKQMQMVKATRAFAGLKKIGLYADIDDLLTLSGLNYSVHLSPVYRISSCVQEPIESARCVTRDDTDGLVGLVGTKYKPLDNHRLAGYASYLAGTFGSRIHKAGALSHKRWDKGSRIVFMSCLGHFKVGDDDMSKQLIITNSHDGSSSLTLYLGVMRIICANGMVAYDKKFNNLIKIRHSNNMTIAMNRSMDLLVQANEVYDRTKNSLIMFNAKKVNLSTHFASQLFPPTIPTEISGVLKCSGQAAKKREAFVKLYKEQDMDDSVYKLYQTATAYIDHDRTIRIGKMKDRASADFDSIMNGTGNALKKKAFDLCTAMVR